MSIIGQQQGAHCRSKSQNRFLVGNVGKLSAMVGLDVNGLSALNSLFLTLVLFQGQTAHALTRTWSIRLQ
jgi:hypothetical protein